MTITARFLRDRRRWLSWWSVGVVGFVFMTVSFYPAIKDQPTFDDLFKNLPEGAKALVGATGLSLTSPAGYLHSQLFTSLLPIALLIFAIGTGARAIGGTEDDGTLEMLLANPVSRTRVVIERFLSVMALTVVLGAVATASVLALSAPFQLLEGISIPKLLAACAAALCLAILHGSLAFALGCALGGRGLAIAIASAVAVGGYVLFGLISAGVIESARFFVPWHWYLSRNIIAEGPGIESLLAPIGLAVALAALGIWRFGPRDLR